MGVSCLITRSWLTHTKEKITMMSLKAKAAFGGFKTDITHGRVSVNIPAKAFCPPMCFLYVCSESCFYTFGRIDWLGGD